MYGYAEIQKKKKYYLENKDIIKQKRKIYVMKNYELVKQCKKISRSKEIKPPRKIRIKIIKTKTELMLQRHKLKCRKLGLRYDLTLFQWNDILNHFVNCAFCESKNIYIGYIISFSRRKGLYYGNVIPICPKCRSSKKNRNLEEWLEFDILRKEYPEKVNRLNEYMRLSK
jgi:hypothetical protein